jgi:hypothetical protein
MIPVVHVADPSGARPTRTARFRPWFTAISGQETTRAQYLASLHASLRSARPVGVWGTLAPMTAADLAAVLARLNVCGAPGPLRRPGRTTKRR